MNTSRDKLIFFGLCGSWFGGFGFLISGMLLHVFLNWIVIPSLLAIVFVISMIIFSKLLNDE